jgi:hypothetical protein
MDRREFSQHLGMSLPGAGAFVSASASTARAATSRTEKEQWDGSPIESGVE